MASKIKSEQEKGSGNKYKNVGIVPPEVKLIMEGHAQTALDKVKLRPHQRKVLLRESG